MVVETKSSGTGEGSEQARQDFIMAAVQYLISKQGQGVPEQQLEQEPSSSKDAIVKSWSSSMGLEESNSTSLSVLGEKGPPALGSQVIFEPSLLILMTSLYAVIMILGLCFNGAMLWVIICRKQNRNPRNLYIANLAISGIAMILMCVPPTLLQIVFGGWWHLGLAACKIVPVTQGANILVSAFTIMVIAVDRWHSVSNTNPNDSLSYRSVFKVIAVVWLLSFTVTSPLLVYQTVDYITIPNTTAVLLQVCVEDFPSPLYRHGFTGVILLVQYIMPLVVLPVVHTKIVLFLKKNSGFQTDPRRREREVKRNRRMTMVLSMIGLTFAFSWLPLHIFIFITDFFGVFQDHNSYFLVLGLCHCAAMSSAFTNPVMYGWLNTSLRSELESLLPRFCREWLNSRSSRRPPTLNVEDVNDNHMQSRSRLNSAVNPTTPRSRLSSFNMDLPSPSPSNGTKQQKHEVVVPMLSVKKLEPRRDSAASGCSVTQVTTTATTTLLLSPDPAGNNNSPGANQAVNV